MPPSTGMTVPVMKPARSEARNADQVGNISGRGKTAKRDARQYSLPRFIGQCGMGHRGIQNSRCDGIDGDAFGSELAREPHGQRHDGGLGRAVERIAHRAAAAHGRDRGDVDDAAAARRRHCRDRRLHAIDDAVDIDPGDAVELAGGQIGDVTGRKESRGIHQNFGGSGLAGQSCECRFNGVCIGDVDGDGVSGKSVARERGRGTRGGALVAIGDPDRATFRRQRARGRFTDAGAAAGDKCDAIFEVKLHLDRVACLRAISRRVPAFFLIDRDVFLMPIRHGIDRQRADRADDENVEADQPGLVRRPTATAPSR